VEVFDMDDMRNGAGKLTLQDHEEIRLAAARGEKQADIAKRFGVTQPRVSQILHASGPLEVTAEVAEQRLDEALANAPESVLRSIMEDKAAPAMARVSAARVVTELTNKREQLPTKSEVERWASAFCRNADREERAVLRRVVDRMLAESDAAEVDAA
jgi:predicted transcriptional regulator